MVDTIEIFRHIRALSVRATRSLFERTRYDRELLDELESHVQMHVDDNLRAGLSAAEARRQALIKLGGIQQTTEHCRDAQFLRWLL